MPTAWIRISAIIAEVIPENYTRKLIKMSDSKKVTIIGPAIVGGGVKPGCFKIGNTGGMMDNILHSNLYRPRRGDAGAAGRGGRSRGVPGVLLFWCIGLCADMFGTYAQFGHAGASAGAAEETATAKNAALGSSYDELGDKIHKVKTGTIVPKAEVPPPTMID